jgi:hypothetical protein
MFIKAKRDFFDDMGHVAGGSVVEVDDAKGADLIRLGLAENIQEGGPSGAGSPISSGQTNAQTGAETSSSSLPVDPALQTPDLPQAPAEPAISPSTTDTGSLPGRTPSTPATAPGGKQKKARKSSRG